MPEQNLAAGASRRFTKPSSPPSTSRPKTTPSPQLRYDLRKMKAHGLVERDGKRYAYGLTAKGNQTALLFVLFHKRVCGPLANSLFNAPPHPESKPATKLEAAYRQGDDSMQRLLQLLAA